MCPVCCPARELSALPTAELAARLAEAYRVIGELTARAEQLAVVNERLTARVEELERQVRRDSASSSRPPSSDSPYKKKGRDRSLRERGKRRPGKQPGDPGTTMKLIDDPDARFWFPPAACRRCGKGLAGAAVLAHRRHQVTDIGPAPPPVVTEYVAQAKQCPCCATVTEGELRPGREDSAGRRRSGEPGHPLPGTGHVRSRREHLPPHRDRQRRPPDRLQVPELRGHDPAVRDPPGPGHFHQ